MTLRLRDVSKSFANGSQKGGLVWALQDISLHLEAPRIGLWGANSAGKSTLLRLLLGLVSPDRGSIEVLGIDVAEQPLALRRSIGWMCDSGPILPHLSAVEAVVLAAQLAGLPAAQADAHAHRLLDYVGLGEARSRQLAGFSKGMRQRVALAQAISGEPRLLLLDEPTEGLDPAERHFILQLIDEFVRRTGAALILSSHVIADVEALCSHLVQLEGGRLRYAGPLVRAAAPSSSRYEVGVEGETQAASEALRAAGLAVQTTERGRLLTTLVPPLDATAILRLLDRAGVAVRHLAPLPPTAAWQASSADGSPPNAQPAGTPAHTAAK